VQVCFKTIQHIESEKARAIIEDTLAIKIPKILQEDLTEDSVPKEIPPLPMKTQIPMSRSELYRKEPAETPILPVPLLTTKLNLHSHQKITFLSFWIVKFCVSHNIKKGSLVILRNLILIWLLGY